MGAKSRVVETYTDPITADAECVDCDARFTATLYVGDTTGSAFARDHPHNGCWVNEQRTVRTTTES